MKAEVAIAEVTKPVVRKAPRARTIRRSNVGQVADALGAVHEGMGLFAMTNGQFSVIDVIEHCLATTGPASVDIATWTAADGDLRRAHAFLLGSQVERVRFVVDPSFKTRKPEFCTVLTELFGDHAIRTIPLHGKFVCIYNEKWNLAIRTSMNLNLNRRIETVEIDDDEGLRGALTGFVDEVFQRPAADNFSRRKQALAGHDVPSALAF